VATGLAVNIAVFPPLQLRPAEQRTTWQVAAESPE
jgi:hypothetical protein